MARWLAADGGSLEDVARQVRAWAPTAADSPLYSLFASRIPEDPVMLAVVARVRSTPPLNVLFAAVQLLLTRDDALAAWYPRLTSDARPAEEAAYTAFRGFVLARLDEIEAICAARTTQTNEVRRCAVLMPVVAAVIAERGWAGPLHAVDLGAAAGLGLCMDAVGYRYDGVEVGAGPLRLECENRAAFPLPRIVPAFATRTGLDLAPLDLDDPAAAAWLEALVWPEQAARLARLRAAIALRRRLDVRMVAGDATRTLPALARMLPPGPIVLWHSIAVYQLDEAAQDALDDAVAETARMRPLVRIAFEPAEGHADVRVGPVPREAAPVLTAHAHGEWIDRP